jgi:organic radical activating enzyme
MDSLRDSIQRFFSRVKPLPSGTYHYQAPGSDPRNYRLHLRLEPDGRGILIINASTVLHLNITAAEFAFYLVQNLPEEQALDNIVARFHIDREQAHQDYENFVERIDTLISTPDLDPVTFLDFDLQAPFSGDISAPYRLDCALTYSLQGPDSGGAAPNERVDRELTTAEWINILDKAWEVGIPHVVFTGGEPTLREDVVELVAHAEDNDQVSGLISDGLRFADQAYLDELLQTGLDHLMMVFQDENQTAWQALENVLAADLFVAVHLTMTENNRAALPGLAEKLAEMGVKAISLSSSDPELGDELQNLREHMARLDLELVWNLPVPYSATNPVALETEQLEEPEGAGRAWLYVEPDGDVLPAQGVNRVLGNFLNDPWEKIWKASQEPASQA